MTRPAKAPRQVKALTAAEAMRMALGPGSQFVGPTESILFTVSCKPKAENRYCQAPKSAGSH